MAGGKVIAGALWKGHFFKKCFKKLIKFSIFKMKHGGMLHAFVSSLPKSHANLLFAVAFIIWAGKMCTEKFKF